MMRRPFFDLSDETLPARPRRKIGGPAAIKSANLAKIQKKNCSAIFPNTVSCSECEFQKGRSRRTLFFRAENFLGKPLTREKFRGTLSLLNRFTKSF